jgi:amidase
MNRRKFLTATAAAAAITRTPTAQSYPRSEDFELDEATAADLQQRMTNGSLTAERIVQLYLGRIEAIDRNGPTLRSVIEINPDAIPIARALDAERKSKGARGPLHGVPVLIKDNIDTADKMQTSAGSLALVGKPAMRDSWVAERLRTAGAVILGKTNLSEWANFRSTHSTSGWSGRGGQTKNPYVLDRNPCGSSSGSGAAVASNLCALAIGTETDGSVICPSSMCGIVGIKPTLGLISRAGIVPIAHSQDTAGPMTRTVRDAAILLGSLTGVDGRDNATQASATKAYADYSQFLDANGLRGARLGVARQYFNMGPAVTVLMEESLDLMRRAGAEIVDPANGPSFDKWGDTEMEVMLYEFKTDLNRYLSGREANVKSLEECIAFNKAHSAVEMPYFAQELFEHAQEKGPLTEQPYKDALSSNDRLARKEGIDAIIAQFKVDAIIGPTAGPAWTTDWIAGDHADSGCASPPAVAGYPHVTVPAGFVFGLPIGISFFGTAWSEPKLIKYAHAFEQARNARRKPQFLPTVNFYA